MARPITAIYGIEPGREGEAPLAHVVGFNSHIAGRGQLPIDQIKRRDENYGDHGLSWFDALSAGIVVASVQARAVAEIHYGEDDSI